MNRQHPPWPRARFVPRLEALEDRAVPTIAAVPVGQQLFIVAMTKETHTVQIMDDPVANKVTVTSPELPGITQTFQNQNITAVTYMGSASPNFTADRGPNMVTYILQSNPGGAAPHTVTFNGGPKNDVFIGQVATSLFGAGTNVTILANGYAGNDTLALFRVGNQGINTQTSLIAIGGPGRNTEILSVAGNTSFGAVLTAFINGGQGSGDTQTLTYQGSVFNQGTVNAFAVGGPGKDTISADVRLGNNSNGTVNVNEFGFAGNDDMKLDVRQSAAADKPKVTAIMDGGEGKNIARSNLLPPFAPAGYIFMDVNFQQEVFDF